MCAKLSVEFDVELKWRFGVLLKGSLAAMVASLSAGHGWLFNP